MIRKSVSYRFIFSLFASLSILTLPGQTLADSFSAEVVRAIFTTKIKSNEPQNDVLILENNKKSIYFFTEVRGLTDKVFYHRWEYAGKVVKKHKIRLRKGRTKYYTRQKLKPNQIGKWTVVVTNAKGWPLKAAIFKYVEKQ